MANSKQAEKRVRQNEKRALANRATQSRIKTLQKKALTAATGGDHEESQKVYRQFVSAVDKAAKNGLFRANKAANLKSRTNKAIKPA